MRYALALLLALLALPPLRAGAETPMTAAEFEAYVTGRTLSFGIGGQVYGIEEYLENRRVRWLFIGGECTDGVWYPQGEFICFVYEAEPTPQCWSFFLRPGGLFARFENRDGATELYETQQTDAPLQCPGPRIGV